jgi:hypothetical protein
MENEQNKWLTVCVGSAPATTRICAAWSCPKSAAVCSGVEPSTEEFRVNSGLKKTTAKRTLTDHFDG